MAKQLNNYTVLTHVDDGKRYEAGETYRCTAQQAAPLIELGVLSATSTSDPSKGAEAQSPPATADNPILVNQATKAELTGLKYIGDATADKLIDGRPFDSLAAVQEATGLPDSKWGEIQSLIALGETAAEER